MIAQAIGSTIIETAMPAMKALFWNDDSWGARFAAFGSALTVRHTGIRQTAAARAT